MKETTRPTVSIIIPHYNQNRLLEKCVASIAPQLTDNDEIIIVDDHSVLSPALEMEDEIKRLRIILLPENRGAASARNLGAEQARGDYIVFLDADDVALPGRIEAQLKAMHLNGDWMGCVGDYTYQRDEKRIAASKETGEMFSIQRALFSGHIFAAGSTLMIKRKFFRDIGGYNPDFRVYEDWDLLLRAVLQSNIGHCGVLVALVSPSSRRAGKEDRLNVLSELSTRYGLRIPQRYQRRFSQALAYERASLYFRASKAWKGLGALVQGFIYAPITLSKRLFSRVVCGRP
ncbi:glycosyltransferase family 2 protein [Brucella sp. BE17]|uniref:glycosyltransferase family 2 protein n=1 Tax=Brucella sp. BE17 TaxID=3142977 RepID=UPI0031BAB419